MDRVGGGYGGGMSVQFKILGPLEVTGGSASHSLGGAKQRAVLAILLLHRGEVVSSERLIDALWGERPPASAAKTLQGYISHLRKALGRDALLSYGHGYRLAVSSDQLDAEQFERLAGEGHRVLAGGDAAAAADRLRQALRLWRGPALADFTYEPFAQAEIARLEEARVTVLEDRIDADLALGRHRQLVSELESLARGYPLRERVRRQLMLALYRCDRQAEALEAYQQTRTALVEELGIEPGHELRELHQAILRQDPRLELAAAAAQIPELEARSSLPAAANPLIGRRAELRALRELLLDEARLVTVTGPGGSGKTRLALELAASLSGEFAQQVYFVLLAPLRQPELPTTIMSALGIADAVGGAPLETLKRVLQAQPVLLVLDNFEHVTDSAPVLGELLADCPQLKLLVTSRASLHLSGEHEYPLDPLPLKDAVALFTERARAVRPEFAADEPILRAICARLDCLPLVVELAAARSRLLSCEELLTRLEHRLDVLTGGPRDLASRQQTLRATIEWSYDLLDPGEQQLFARLAVFTGGCTLEAAEQVCGASLDQIESLIDQNLLRRSETTGEGRFWMLETIREYALERLAVTTGVEEACQPYADYYVALARQRVAEHDHGQRAALDALERDLDNIRSALAWKHEAGSAPVPVDDGACDHLAGLSIPPLVLDSTQGPLDLAGLAAERLVLYVHPGTTGPGQSTLPGLSEIPGGLGCTPQALAFRDHATELAALGARVVGLSVVAPGTLVEFSEANHISFPVIADPERRLETALRLPTFQVAGVTLYRRVTLIAERGTIVKVLYPVFPPERNANEVIAWLSSLDLEFTHKQST
ncbi:MAG: AfsR/SARP family transcriptional regulator [Solirubrobacteraceae bacterium]